MRLNNRMRNTHSAPFSFKCAPKDLRISSRLRMQCGGTFGGVGSAPRIHLQVEGPAMIESLSICQIDPISSDRLTT